MLILPFYQAFNNATLGLTQDPNIDPSRYCSSDVLLFRDEYSFRWEGSHSGPPSTDLPRVWNAPAIFVANDTKEDAMYQNQGEPALDSDYDPKYFDAHNHGSSRRTRRARSSAYGEPVFGHLVTSNMSHHSARMLCEDERSFGPDFVSHVEGRYCDMNHKMHFPICVPSRLEVDCFNASLRAVVGLEGSVAKNYTHVVEW